MIPDDITPIDEALLRRFLAADAAMAGEAASGAAGERSWLDDCLRLLDLVGPAAGPGDYSLAPAFGRYRIVREIGRGGFGVVYLARDDALGRDVALKVPLPERLASPDVRRRFVREARATAVLDHPRIVPVYEAGEIGPLFFIATAYCDGPSLSDWLRAEAGPASPRAAAAMIAELAGAVQHAHDRGILHRDLKPSNVLLQAPTGVDPVGAPLSRLVPRVTDFGLAKLVDDDEAEETRTGVPLGSPPYMAPEQAAGRRRDIGPATDVYALGATLYEVLAGRPPFRGETPAETIRQVLERDPIPPRMLRHDLPRDLETICLKCLEKDPARRYPSASALADDLARFLDGRTIAARPSPAWERLAKRARRRPLQAAMSALSALVVAFAAGGIAWSNAWLRAHNDRLRRALERADYHARDAALHRRIAEDREALAGRHLHAAQLRLARQAYDVRQFERAQEILLDDEYGPGPAHRDFAWRYLWHLSRRRVALIGRHDAPVRGIALSPDGRALASGGATGGIRIWDVAEGRARAVLTGHAGRVERLAFSPDGRRLATAARTGPDGVDFEIALWDVDRALPLPSPRGAIAAVGVLDLRFMDGGRLLAALSHDALGVRTLRAWDVATGREARSRYVVGGLGDVAPFPDGSGYAVREAGGRVTVRDAATGRIARTITDREPEAWPLAVSADGRFVAASVPPARLLVWDLSAPDPSTPRTFDDGVHPDRLEFAPDGGTLVAVRQGWRVSARDLSTGHGRVLVELEPRREGSFHLAFSPDGARLAMWGGGQPGGRIPVSVWRLSTGAKERDFPGRFSSQFLAFARDGRSLYLGGEHEVSAWRIDPPQEFDTFTAHRSEAWSVAFSPDGRSVASGGNDHHLRIWDPSTGRERIDPPEHEATVGALAYRPDGRVIAAGCLEVRDNLRLWDATTGRAIASLPGHTERVRSLAYRPDGGLLASAGSDRTIRLWDGETGEPRGMLSGHEDVVRQVAFAPDGRTLASASNDRTVRLWDLAGRRCRAVLRGREKVAAVAYAPDGRTLASADEWGLITLRDPFTGEARLVINADDVEVRALAFSPDGRTLATAGISRTIRLWDPVTGQGLLDLEGNRGQVNALAFSPDGSMLLSADHAGAVRIYRGTPR